MKSKTSSNTIALVGGGTWWHAFPLVNIVRYFRAQAISVDFVWIGEKWGIEERLAHDNDIPFCSIFSGKLRRYFSWKTLLVPFQISLWVIQSLLILHREKPRSIFSKWGYVSLPVAIAGWIARVPVYLHESDSVPGLANRLVAKFSRGIFCSFESAGRFFPTKKILWYGPILPLELLDKKESSADNHTRKKLLINCGSQGSSSIFDTVLSELSRWNSPIHEFDIHVILWSQNAHYRPRFESYPDMTVYDLMYDLKSYFDLVRQCDVVITRSGSSIFEFAALGLPMIMIPHPHTGGNHQYYNALEFEKMWHKMIAQDHLRTELPSVLSNIPVISNHVSVLRDDTPYRNIVTALMWEKNGILDWK